MPARWRQRLRHHFWRPHAFRELLDSFCAGRGARRTSISPLVDRVAGGDVNPYLMLAAILGAALDGIEKEMEPPSPIVGNAYAVDGLPQIAEDWETAIDALEQSTIVPRFLHPELIKNLISTKRQELHYLGELSDSEKIELYLDTV